MVHGFAQLNLERDAGEVFEVNAKNLEESSNTVID
jgi:hypothetical protein